ncbi:MAG: oligosaccharide flippase family protein [Candidatus Thermoplasmatota archaeon]
MRDILKAMSKTSGGFAVSSLLGVASSKIMAVILGPAGVGLYSMLIQMSQTSGLLATLAGGPALVQGIARREKAARERYVRAIFLIFLIGGFVTALALVITAPVIAPAVLGSGDSVNVWLVRFLSLPVALNAFATYFAGILNGYRAIGRMAVIQIVVAGTNAAIAYPVCLAADSGYLLALVWLMTATSSMSLVLNLYVALRNGWIKPLVLRLRESFDKESVRHFVSLAGTTLATALLSSFVLLIVRLSIIQNGGMDKAGVFNAAWSLSMTYVGAILVSCGTYYLPTLSKTNAQGEKLSLIRDYLRISIMIIVPIAVFIVTAKQFVISLLFSGEFLEATSMTRWMLVGDYMRVTGWVLAMPMFAYADVRTFLALECCSSMGFLTISLGAMDVLSSLEGVGISYVVVNSVYVAFAFIYLIRRHGFRSDSRLKSSWLGGLSIIAIASVFCWNDEIVFWPKCVISVAASFIFVIAILDETERARLWCFIRSISPRIPRQ